MAESKQTSYDRMYCYQDSTVLKNKKGIKNQDDLDKFERSYTTLRITELKESILRKDFSLEYLKKIHEYIFQDVYDWAGKIRGVEIAKGNMFCKVIHIDSYAKDIFYNLKKDNYLKGLGDDDFCKKLAVFYSDINALHPFREGNGRTQRFFIEELAKEAGHPLDLMKISYEENLQASRMSLFCDYSGMEMIIKKALVKEPGKDQNKKPVKDNGKERSNKKLVKEER